MKPSNPFSRESYELAYDAAFIAMGLDPSPVLSRILAEQTELPGELYTVIRAMCDASARGPVASGLKAIAAIRASEHSDTEPCEAIND